MTPEDMVHRRGRHCEHRRDEDDVDGNSEPVSGIRGEQSHRVVHEGLDRTLVVNSVLVVGAPESRRSFDDRSRVLRVEVLASCLDGEQRDEREDDAARQRGGEPRITHHDRSWPLVAVPRQSLVDGDRDDDEENQVQTKQRTHEVALNFDGVGGGRGVQLDEGGDQSRSQNEREHSPSAGSMDGGECDDGDDNGEPHLIRGIESREAEQSMRQSIGDIEAVVVREVVGDGPAQFSLGHVDPERRVRQERRELIELSRPVRPVAK